MYVAFFKRLLDLLLSLVGLIVLSPLLIVISVLIKSTSKGPVLFKQKRVGKNNTSFRIFKFRTMRIDTPKDCPTHLLQDSDSFITKIGGFLRKTSLDELPQLWNILVGDMSIVGPRPSLPNQVDLNVLRDKNNASKLKPGLTGLAQISGRDELDIEIKAQYDGEYSYKITFYNDLKIVVKTVINVMKSDGIKEGKIL